MLINTVILFLQDALPILILISLLLLVSQQHKLTINWLLIGLVIATVFVFLLNQKMPFISKSYDYTGMERLFSVGFFLIYLTTSLLYVVNKSSEYLKVSRHYWFVNLLVAFSLTISLNSISFIIYFNNIWQHQHEIEPLLLGIVLGIGISVSVAILLYFVLSYLIKNVYQHSARLLLLFFGAGQLMEVSHLLSQIDLLSSNGFIWDSSKLVSENSALGYFFIALFGYDATPSTVQVFSYLSALFIPVFASYYLAKHVSLKNTNSQEVLE